MKNINGNLNQSNNGKLFLWTAKWMYKIPWSSCFFDSRTKDQHWIKKNYLFRNVMSLEKQNVINESLVTRENHILFF